MKKQSESERALSCLVSLIMFLTFMITWPFLVIWAVNTLFATGIEYTFITWLAGFIILYCIGTSNGTISLNTNGREK